MKTLQEVKAEYLNEALSSPVGGYVVMDRNGKVAAHSNSEFVHCFVDPLDLEAARANGYECKDEEIAGLNKRLKELLAEKARLQELHKSEIGKLRNGYQKEIEAAIRRAETAEQQSKEKDAVIDRQRKRIAQLDRNANPQRYSLSSGAELVRINVSNYRNPSLHIWTKVGEELFEDTKFQIDYDVAQKHFNGQITDEEFVNTVFEPQEQVSGKQAELLGAAFTLAAGGPAEVHVGTGGGGSSSELPWRDKDKYSKKQTTTRR